MDSLTAKIVRIASVAFVVSILPHQSFAVTPDLLTISETTVTRWNIDTTTTISTPTGTSIFGDMTRTNDGRYIAYRTSYGGATPALFQIDPQTGTTQLLVQSTSAASKVVALTPTANNDLLACDNSLGFIRINPSTLSYMTVTITPSNHASYLRTGAMATSPSGDIYCWGSGFSASESVYSALFRIDLTAGTALEIGGYTHLSTSADFQAMAFSPDGRLFGFTEINAPSPLTINSVYQINLQTGLPTFIEQRSFLASVRGAVFIVPEPSTLCLVTPLVLALHSRRRRGGGAVHTL